MILAAMTGSETFTDASAKCHVFSVPTAALPYDGKELHMNLALREGERQISRVRNTKHQIAPNYRDELGAWNSSVYEVPEGAMLKVFGMLSTGWNKRNIQANMFIQMRATAAHRRLRVRLTQKEVSTFHYADIEGRFDELTLQEALDEGAKVPLAYRKFYSENQTRDIFESRVMEPELSARQLVSRVTVPTLEGEQSRVRRRPGRALEF